MFAVAKRGGDDTFPDILLGGDWRRSEPVKEPANRSETRVAASMSGEILFVSNSGEACFPPIEDFRICDDVAVVNRLGILAYGIAVAIVALFTAHEVISTGAYLYEGQTSSMVALGVSGWFMATLGPLILSVCCWQLARGAGRKWMWHLIFVPVAIMIYQAGASILFYAAGVPDGDSVEGYTLITGDGLLLFTLSVHAVALVAQGVATVSGKATVR